MKPHSQMLYCKIFTACNGSGRYACGLGDISCRQAVERRKTECIALLGRQFGKSSVKFLPYQATQIQCFRRIGRRRGQRTRQLGNRLIFLAIERHRIFATSPPEVQDGITRHAIKPCRYALYAIILVGDTTHKAIQHILQYILGILFVAYLRAYVAEKPWCVLRHYRIQLSLLAHYGNRRGNDG